MAAEAADPSRSGADGAAGAGGVIGGGGGGREGARGVLPCCAPAAALGLRGRMQGDVSSPILPPLPPPQLLCCRVGFEGGEGTPSAAQWGWIPPHS